jgi:hypothetical protein
MNYSLTRRSAFATASMSALAIAAGLTNMPALAADAEPAGAPVAVLDRARATNETSGMRAGSFIFTPYLIGKVTHDDNVYAARVRTTDMIFSTTPGLQFKSDWSRHSLEGEFALDAIKYSRQAKLDHINARIGGVGKFELGSSSNIVIESRFVRSGDTVPTTGAVSPDGPIMTNSLVEAATFNTRFNRFIWSAGINWSWTNYENAKSFGVPVDQSFRNGAVTTLTQRFGYEISPSTTVFLQPQYNFRRYKNSAYNSEGYRIYGGLSTEMTRLVRGEIYGGYLFQDYVSPAIPNVSSYGFGGRIIWYPMERLTINLNANRDIGDPSALGAPASVNTSFGAQADYEIYHNLVWSLGGTYAISKYTAPSYTDYTYGANTGLTYYITRNISAIASWNRTWRENAFIFANNYNRNQISLGVRGQF